MSVRKPLGVDDLADAQTRRDLQEEAEPARRTVLRAGLLGGLVAGAVMATEASAAAPTEAAQAAEGGLVDPRNHFPSELHFPEQAWPGLQRRMDPKPDCGETSYTGRRRLVGRKALITGGDSGIGRAVAIAFAKEGADVVIAHLPQEQPDADDVLDVIRRAGRKGVSIAGDLQSMDFCTALVRRAAEELDGLDILVNNAGYSRRHDSILEHPPEQWDQTIKTNLYAPFWLSKAALEYLPPGSSIINTASVAAEEPVGFFLDYCASKAGLAHFTRALAKQLGPRGIRVNAVAPGSFFTPLLGYTGGDDSKIAGMNKTTPLGRIGQPVEIAPLYVTLASVAGLYTSGSVWSANGGTAQF
jgi:NAD(P)-dependent dehydrogenase (short-subunit alcohol dehydrogenase family)